jgi:hypothetical protein
MVDRVIAVVALLLFVLVSMAVASSVAAAMDARSARGCKEPNHPGTIENTIVGLRAHQVGCRTARRVSNRFRNGRKDPLGFKCYERVREAAAEVKCFRGQQRVVFGIVVF